MTRTEERRPGVMTEAASEDPAKSLDIKVPDGTTPIPLIGTVPLPGFPICSFSEVIASMAQAVAEQTQTDLGMSATSTLTVLAAAVGGKVEVEVRPGWREQLNLFTATVAAPGERKSAVQSILVAPLRIAEQQLVREGAAERREQDTRKQIALRAAELARTTASKAKRDDRDARTADAIAEIMQADAIDVPSVPRLLADDTTPEALASLMAEQGGRIAVVSAEGGVFDAMAGRYTSGATNIDVYLKAYSGDALRVDRVGRPAENIEHPALTMGLMIQPHVLSAIGTNTKFRGRGLLARFLYCIPESKLGHRRPGSYPVPDKVSDGYNALISELVLAHAKVKAPIVLTLEDAAQRAVIALETLIEPELSGPGELAGIADWGGKFCGLVCRLAGLLHLALHGEIGTRLPITAKTVQNAIGLGEYYKANAISAFINMRTDPVVADAEYLLALIRRRNVVNISTRDLFSAVTRARFNKVTALYAPIDILVEYGWLSPVEDPARTGPGRHSSPRWLVHPSAGSAESAES